MVDLRLIHNASDTQCMIQHLACMLNSVSQVSLDKALKQPEAPIQQWCMRCFVPPVECAGLKHQLAAGLMSQQLHLPVTKILQELQQSVLLKQKQARPHLSLRPR